MAYISSNTLTLNTNIYIYILSQSRMARPLLFSQGAIACNISTCKKQGLVSFLLVSHSDTSAPTRDVEMWPLVTKEMTAGVKCCGHLFMVTLEVLPIQHLWSARSCQNDLPIGTNDIRFYFLQALILQAIAPCKKLEVWPHETNNIPLAIIA